MLHFAIDSGKGFYIMEKRKNVENTKFVEGSKSLEKREQEPREEKMVILENGMIVPYSMVRQPHFSE